MQHATSSSSSSSSNNNKDEKARLFVWSGRALAQLHKAIFGIITWINLFFLASRRLRFKGNYSRDKANLHGRHDGDDWDRTYSSWFVQVPGRGTRRTRPRDVGRHDDRREDSLERKQQVPRESLMSYLSIRIDALFITIWQQYHGKRDSRGTRKETF